MDNKNKGIARGASARPRQKDGVVDVRLYFKKKYSDKEGYQAKQNLDRVSELTEMAHDIIEDKDELPSWIQDKISEMDHHAEAVYSKLKYDAKRDNQNEEDFNKAVRVQMAQKAKEQREMTQVGGQDILKDAVRKSPSLGKWAAFIAGLAISPDLAREAENMTPTQRREWERTVSRQMKKTKNKDILRSLKMYMKDNNDTYVRKTPVKNGVKLEKKLAVPPFQGAQWDPTIHRWVKGGEVGNSVVNRGGKKRIRGTGAGAHSRSVGGHGKGGERVSKRPIQRRKKDVPSGVKRSSAVQRFLSTVQRTKKKFAKRS